MIRRRRPNREIQFSFDSFLDVVANVVGIILRLILVAWAGARLYKGPPPPEPPALPALEEHASLPDPRDPMVDDLEQQRLLLIRAQAHLLEHLQQGKQARNTKETVAGQIKSVAQQRQALEQQLVDQRRKQAEQEQLAQRAREQWTQQQEREAQQLSLSMAEIRSRSLKLIQEIEELKKKPSQKQTLRYRTPVSAPLQTDEVQWECQNGRVALLDVGALETLIRRDQRDQQANIQAALKTTGMFTAMTPSVGAFRLRYGIERSTQVSLNGGQDLTTWWKAVPVLPDRGETVEQAFQPGSEFRRIVDNLEANETAVTFWVYPDSFPLYRQLRDYLHEKDIVVAGRPLLPGMQIGAHSRNGSASRGQ